MAGDMMHLHWGVVNGKSGLPPVQYSGNGGANDNASGGGGGGGGMHLGDVSIECMRISG